MKTTSPDHRGPKMIRRLPFAALLLSGCLAAPAAFAQDAAPAPAAAPAKGPANLCQELIAFVQKPEEKKQEAATPPKQATAVSNASGKSDGQPSTAGGDPQQKSGLSGPTNTDTKAPTSDTRAPVSDGKTVLAQANAAAKSPPPPGAPAPSPKPDPAVVAQLEAAAGANDQTGCRAAARAMRVAGVIMPPPLLALAALNPKLFAGSQP
ncbi:hypothetical protein [Methylobacterium sp. Leaf465]|uniref:hypothetical protein n=1 Tax=Methylobacterium sp. Leaf465 TaxID=1736385 RepID=UPI001FCD4B69|nr:hypothetical protein [Methylobacterium sp. Leaf465]